MKYEMENLRSLQQILINKISLYLLSDCSGDASGLWFQTAQQQLTAWLEAAAFKMLYCCDLS